MTCKDCIHSGLCYKENDYENFPDRCGDFISDKVLEERPQGEWIYLNKDNPMKVECPFCHERKCCVSNYCDYCGARMKGGVK